MKKILVVDDELDILEAVKKRLENQGFAVVAVSDGLKAVEKVNAEKFDLILMDVMMPGISGGETISLIKKNNKLTMPVIFVTGIFAQNGEKGINVGGDLYPAIAKPFQFEVLLKKIDDLMPVS